MVNRRHRKPEYLLILLAVAGIVLGTLATLGGNFRAVGPDFQPTGTLAGATPEDEKEWTVQDEQNTVEVFEFAKRGVVKVSTSQGVDYGGVLREREGNGSGFFIDSDAHVVTNYHVVEGATDIKVQTISGKTYDATVQGSDRLTDLAVLTVDMPSDEVYPLALADYSQVRVGQKAIVLGSPLATGSSMGLDRSPTVTIGIISAKDRSMPIESLTKPNVNDFTIEDLIQTDAAVNPGNSGGPLLNSSGEVVGVVTAIMDSANGIGFAIPSQVVSSVVPQLISLSKVTRAFMGVSFLRLDLLYEELGSEGFDQAGYPTTRGALITDVDEGGPAEKAGLRAALDVVTVGDQEVPFGGDIITGLDGVLITGSNLSEEILRHAPGDVVTLDIMRQDRKMSVDVVLGSR